MSGADNPLASFAFTAGLDWWQAELPVPLWGGPIEVVLDAPSAGPSPRQVATLRAVLGQQVRLKFTPELDFEEDVGLQQVERVNELLRQIESSRGDDDG